MKPIIKVENLSKQYRLGTIGTGTLRNDFKRWLYRIRGKEDPFSKVGESNDRTVKGTSDYVWALKDINFEVMPGEVLGVIGKNGAGKSTLLKILSKVTGPTTGRIDYNGRIGSLLEVGTGFHPELTGRENIFLNGAILGMTRQEIRSKLDEIIDFSGCERYIDTPVKRYSSGMTVRLGFAVAAHLEPEILVVDEVLSVGDLEFQKKAVGKMQDVSKNEGRTVLFVSHNLGTISQLCSKTIMFEKGTIVNFDRTNKVLDFYLHSNSKHYIKFERDENIIGNQFESIEMVDIDLNNNTDFAFDKEICVKLKIKLPEFNSSLELAMRLMNKHKNAVFTIHEKLYDLIDSNNVANIIITIPRKILTPGRYSWIMCINHPGKELFDLQDDILPFNVIDTGSDFARYEGQDYGSVFATYKIKTL